MKGIIFDGRKVPPEFHMKYKFADTRICEWNILYIKLNDNKNLIEAKSVPLHLDDYKYAVHDEMIDFEIVDSGKSADYSIGVSGGSIDAFYINNTYGANKIGTNLSVGRLKLNPKDKIRLGFNNLKIENKDQVDKVMFALIGIGAIIIFYFVYLLYIKI